MQAYKDSIKMGSGNKESKKGHCPTRDSSLLFWFYSAKTVIMLSKR